MVWAPMAEQALQLNLEAAEAAAELTVVVTRLVAEAVTAVLQAAAEVVVVRDRPVQEQVGPAPRAKSGLSVGS
jgi:hypothetical protein